LCKCVWIKDTLLLLATRDMHMNIAGASNQFEQIHEHDTCFKGAWRPILPKLQRTMTYSAQFNLKYVETVHRLRV
jgi:hypothetical protein